MVSLKLRLIREFNRIYTHTLKILYRIKPYSSRIFLFHDVVEDVSQVKNKFTISQHSFESFLLYQLSKGNHPNTFEELSNIIFKKKRSSDSSFIVSFDDANESVFTIAYPFLREHQIPFIIFITKDLIGKPNFLNENQIRLLSQDSLCTVGSHACHHIMFRYLSVKEAEKELTKSQEYLENLLNVPVKSFAFPYGRLIECSFKNIKTLQQSSYHFAFSAITGTLNQGWVSSKYFLPRINVDEKIARRVVESNDLMKSNIQ